MSGKGWSAVKAAKAKKAKSSLMLIGMYRKRNQDLLSMTTKSAEMGAKYRDIFHAAEEGKV
jgi:hypothetical protein